MVGVAVVSTLVVLAVVEADAVAVVVAVQCSGGRGLLEDTVDCRQLPSFAASIAICLKVQMTLIHINFNV